MIRTRVQSTGGPEMPFFCTPDNRQTSSDEPEYCTTRDNPSNAHGSCTYCPRGVVWTWLSFDQIPSLLLYSALRLRQDIFIVEQSVPYPDIDGRDLQSRHLFGLLHGELVAYLRALPRDLFEPGHLSFGRVVVKKEARGFGMGRAIVKECIDSFQQSQKGIPIKISSQLYLKDFYASFGFETSGEPYIEDMIPHIAMIKR